MSLVGSGDRSGVPTIPPSPLHKYPDRGRILCITSNFPRWEGDSTTPFVLHLAQDLQSLGWDVDVLAPHAPGAALAETILGVNVERFRYAWPPAAQTVCYGGGALVNLREDRKNLAKVPSLVGSELFQAWRRIRGRNYDAIHSHWLVPQGFVGSLVGRAMSVPHVTTVHGGDVFALGSRAIRPFKQFAIRNATSVTVNSSATLRAVGDLGRAEGVYRIPMGVDTTPAPPEAIRDIRHQHQTESDPLVVFVGRLIVEKGIEDLLDALALLKTTHPTIRALIVGEGPHRSRFESHAERIGLAPSVCFTGWVAPEKVSAYLAAADVFVGPSKRAADGWTEAYGLTFAEALAAGTPVVATQAGGITDIVEHEKNGVIVDESAPPQIASAIRRIIENPDWAAELGSRGRAKARRTLSREASAEAFSKLFTSLTGARRSSQS